MHNGNHFDSPDIFASYSQTTAMMRFYYVFLRDTFRGIHEKYFDENSSFPKIDFFKNTEIS